MGQRETSVVRQRRLRAELRRIREESGRTQRAVADALGWSTSKVVRIETGAVSVSTSDVMALLHHYGINDPGVAEGLLAPTRTREEGWWSEYRSFYGQQFLNFLGYEDSATRIRQYEYQVVPGLLQTEDYARAIIADYNPDDEGRVERGNRIRMRRQGLLDRPHGPELLYVLDEDVIHRWVGGPDVMLRQLARLKDLLRHPRISIQIVPFAEGMYVGLQGPSFTIFDLPPEDDVVTIIEQPHRDLIVDDPEASDNFIKKFSMLQQIACPEGRVSEIIDSAINRMRLGANVYAGRFRRTTKKSGPTRNEGGGPAMSPTSTEDQVPAPWKSGKLGRGRGPTVGLVTAMPEEFVAMRALLEHSVESYVAHDPALYVLGTLPSRDHGQRHGVALTLLAATATNAAANGCANLVRSFPSITVIIMVGIAAGIPSLEYPERHVRLGDIVVATQVVDFDHVRAVDGGTVPRQPMSLPSPRLTHCADILRADELSGKRTWEQWLDPSRPGLVRYGRPPESTDVVHDSVGRQVRHPRRDQSGHREGFPKVHYGPIGSSNRALRDATVRDQLAARHGFIALEMEGAGVGSSGFLNSREWFIVRGISDYGDRHCSELWRRYAALAAAAYVRALLAKCLPFEHQRDHRQVTLAPIQ